MDKTQANMQTIEIGTDLDTLCVNTIRFLAVDMVQKADSGHPGLPLDAAPMAYTLWSRFLRFNPRNPSWFNRDRFVLSAGHGSALLYALLYLMGYDLSLDEIKRFRQWDSKTPGHPESERTPGVEVTTGPLGQGFGNGVGMAIAEAHLAARYNQPDIKIVDHYTYVLASDGDLMEGISSEAGSLAGHLKLGKLIYLYDNNHISLAGSTNVAFTEDRAKRFEAFGWHIQSIDDGNDMEAIAQALRAAREETQRPSLILVRTHIGYGSPHKQDTYHAHGEPLGEEEVKLTKENLNWPTEPAFYVPDEALDRFRQAADQGQKAEDDWNELLARYTANYPDLADELLRRIRGDLPQGWDSDIPHFDPDADGMKTRVASQKVMNAIAPKLPDLIGGAADFGSPAAVADDMQGAIGGGWSYAGRNLHFGVREHAMGAILNGMAAHGAIMPFGGTFLIFSDYMRPTIRLAALMGLHVIYVFTHDSIGLGEDGPTHQPIEQLASLRAIPRLVVIRPGDANEAAEAWRLAAQIRGRPVALIFTRQNVPILDRSHLAGAKGLHQGAYVLADAEKGRPDILLLATGSELQLAVGARDQLAADGVQARVVSMPSWEIFDEQTQEYRDQVLLPSVRKRLAIEAAAPLGWSRYVGDEGAVIGVTTFGASAPGQIVMAKYGFTVEHVVERARALLESR
jgi:transketolase